MKSTRSGKKWAHVSCALWIPEVSIGCVEKMEPITKISSIPQSRWALICVLCRERVGACIQCSVKTCKTAYHVTCAFKHGLEMRAIIEDENADDGVKLRSYCEKHSKSSKKEKGVCSGSEDEDFKKKKRKDMTSEEKNQARAARLQEIEAEFYKLVSIKDIGLPIDIDSDCLQSIYNYWKLKRKAGNNKPLLPPKTEDVDMLSNKKEQADLEKMKMFVQLRQDLERVRNLCYMVSRREKLSRTFFRMREQTFYKQTAVLEPSDYVLPSYIVQAVIEANHGPSIYDRLYSYNTEDQNFDFDTLLTRIAGVKSPKYESETDKKNEMNGLFKDVKNNPYKKLYFNGSSKRRGGFYDSASSSNSSDEMPKENKENRIQQNQSETEMIRKKNAESYTNKSINKLLERRRRLSRSSQNLIDSSSDDCTKVHKKSWSKFPRSRLRQVESELGKLSGTDSDEIISFSNSRQSSSQRLNAISSIYSDSESSDASLRNDDKSSNAASDSQQSRLRTKAAVKEFSNKQLLSKSPNKSSPENRHKIKHAENTKKAEAEKQKDYVPSDLIVPQRQAAKKASENLKSTKVKDPVAEQEKVVVNADSKQKNKKYKKENEPKKLAKATENPTSQKKLEKSTNPEIFTYVPQRQAAKKAAEHIKSGLGKTTTAEATNDLEKAKKEPESIKDEIESVNFKEKNVEIDKKLSSDDSRSSSSASSSSSSSTSSSDSEKETQKTEFKNTISPYNRTERTVCDDWPFLDKAAKSPTSNSSSDTNNSYRQDESLKHIQNRKSRSPTPQNQKENSGKYFFLETSENSPHKKPSSERKESACNRKRANRDNTQPSDSSDWIGNANVRLGTLSNSKSNIMEVRNSRKEPSNESKKVETKNSNVGLLSPVRKTSKKVNEDFISSKSYDFTEEIENNKNCLRSKKHVSDVGEKVDLRSSRRHSEVSLKVTETVTCEQQRSLKNNDVISKNSSALNLDQSKNTLQKLSYDESCNENIPNLLSLEKTMSTSLDEEKLLIVNDNMDFVRKMQAKPAPFQNRSIFSPQPQAKDDLLDFENILEDGFGISKDEILKGPLTFSFSNEPIVKEDSKEDSARETLNLVEKLRMEMSKKSTNTYDIDENSMASSIKNDNDRSELSEQIVPNDIIEPSFKEDAKIDKTNCHVVQISNELSKESNNFDKTFDLKKDFNIETQNVHDTEHLRTINTENKLWPSAYEQTNVKLPNLQNSKIVEDETNAHHNLKMLNIQDHISLNNLKEHINSEIAANLESESVHTPFLDSATVDEMTISSPYGDVRRGAEWTESEMMPHRRSTTSSPTSVSSSSPKKNKEDEIVKHSDVTLINRSELEMPYGNVSQIFPNTTTNATFETFAEAAPFIGSGLFPNPNINPLAFPTVGTIFPPNFDAAFHPSQTAVSSIPPIVEENRHCPTTAAFTSSQHNMALTAAMINLTTEETKLETVQPQSSPKVEVPCTPEKKEASASPTTNNVPALSLPTDAASKPPPVSGKKSPSKPTRSSSRFATLQGKSPSKSPSKSPRQENISNKNSCNKGKTENKRNAGKLNSGRSGQAYNRGRGRGKGRNKTSHLQTIDSDYLSTNTIHNKLVGTVYDLDFDDGISDSMTDLKAMRERRKSVDNHEKRLGLSQGPHESPTGKYCSNQSNTKRAVSVDVLKPPPPVDEIKKEETSSSKSQDSKAFPDMVVQPVLPGPVDMRTYSNFETLPFNNNTNILNVFNNSNTESQIPEEMDEEFEKELHSAAKKTNLKKTDDQNTPEISNIKVSLSDARNQLKVKIKGPIANYTSNVVPIQSNTESNTISTIGVNSSASTTVSTTSGNISSGSSNLRRMRKKELLRQYWTQENMDEPSTNPGSVNTPALPPRTIITIPKAVASMTTIPTKDDYRDYRLSNDELIDTKYKKEIKSRPLSRELKQLDLSLDEDAVSDRRRSFDNLISNKKRGRPPRPPQTTPKLKIKIGEGNDTQCNMELEENKDRIRPPKKRIATMAMPSVEDLKRESMKYRKLVMAGFGEEKEKKKKKNKNDKHKKKKIKRELQIISNDSVSPTKLVIRIGKRAEAEDDVKKVVSKENEEDTATISSKQNTKCDIVLVTSCKGGVESDQKCSVEQPLSLKVANNSNKVTPIKLKLSRCLEGSGYVMKSSDSDNVKTDIVDTVTTPPPPSIVNLSNHVNSSNPISVNKNCEVR